MASELKTYRRQPQCDACSHSRSFHGGGKTRCRALGCRCDSWANTEEETVTTDSQFFAATSALLLSGDVQARTVSNDEYTGVEIKLEDGTRVIWTQDVGAWVATMVAEGGEPTTIRTGAIADTPEQAAALIATYEYDAA